MALVALGIGAVISLQRCDSDDDGCRYIYNSLLDCEAEWGAGACRLKGGRVYSPEQQHCDSHSVRVGSGAGGHYGGGSGGDNPPGKGERAIGVERGGFGGTGRFGGG